MIFKYLNPHAPTLKEQTSEQLRFINFQSKIFSVYGILMKKKILSNTNI